MNDTLGETEALLASFTSNEISVQAFCTLFEDFWNFKARRNMFSDQALESLNFLFDEVVLFSPFPREEWSYPNYRDGNDIRRAAAQALQSIRT